MIGSATPSGVDALKSGDDFEFKFKFKFKFKLKFKYKCKYRLWGV